MEIIDPNPMRAARSSLEIKQLSELWKRINKESPEPRPWALLLRNDRRALERNADVERAKDLPAILPGVFFRTIGVGVTHVELLVA